MHIKTLRIQGFKSYRDQTAVEEFSPGHNVVVGRNGSGKSNFFAAIRFVLSDAYNSMSREERQALLHDSSASTSATLSAFVEIVFDNSDGRFPHGSNDELVLRRTIGLKKDEYSLDRKSVTKQDVLNMLEAAGFSRANPYYIVPQGRITHLTNMKDSDRLNLLKDVAGTKVYETRRADSLRIMEETNGKKEKILELLEYIDARLLELDEERKELKEYHEKDKERRCLEYALYYKQQQDALGRQEDLTTKKDQETAKVEEATRRFNERDEALERLQRSLATMQEKATRLIADRDSLLEERRDLSRKRAALESSIQDEEARAEQTQESRADLETRRDELDRRISEVEGELMGLLPQLEDQERGLAQARAALDDTKAKSSVLIAKQARSNQYETKAQRDAALHEEIKSLDLYETSQTATRSEVQDEINEMQTRLDRIGSTMSEKLAAWDREDAFVRGRAAKWDEIKDEEDKRMDERKSLWREEKKLVDNAKKVGAKLDGARKTLYELMDRATANGLRAVEEIAQRLGLQGVYGPLYKLFTVENRYKRAVESTAGQSLFHIVVDTDETASKVLEVLHKERSGRVTFVPLNRIKPKVMQFQEKGDALLMIKKVSFDAKYKLAMQQIFGRTIICPSLAVASSYVKSDDINAITIDGDRIERKGALTGGSHDAKKSRLDAAHAVGNYQEEHQAESDKLREVQTAILSLDQRINVLASEREQLQSRSKQVMRGREVLKHEIEAIREEEHACQRGLKKLQEDLEQIASNLSTCLLKKNALQAELQTPLRRGLASREEAELKALTTLGDEQEKQLNEKIKSVQTMRNQKEMLEIELHGNLKRERETVASQLDSYGESTGFSQEATEASGRSLSQSIAAHKKQLSDTKKLLNVKQKALDQTEKHIEELQIEVKAEQEELDEKTREQANEARSIDKLDKILTQIMVKVRNYAKRREDAEQKIRELGVVPGEAYQRHIASSAENIMKALHKINSALKKYSNVNKRAVEQYENFTRQRDQLLSRQQDLETSSESIEELIETLDMRKDEAIERTFKQVSRNFNEIFEKLVPMGRGMLVMQRKFDAEADDDAEDEDEDAMQVDEEEGEGVSSKRKNRSSIENYTGVSIKVSFHSKVDEGVRIQQLSGGQKSLVALAIVFAIQKCDPAAFYLFDEIDANLDAQYRTAVASMIQELSASAQFITTTFRPELVGVGEKHYGVLFNAHKVSSLQPISQDEAYQFVESSSQTA